MPDDVSKIVDLTSEKDPKAYPRENPSLTPTVNTSTQREANKTKKWKYLKLSDKNYITVISHDRIKMEMKAMKIYKNSLGNRRKPDTNGWYRIQKRKVESKKGSKLGAITITGLICIITSMVLYSLFEIKCCDKPDPVILKNLLNANIFGQKEAVEQIVSALKNDNSKLLIIYGGTGVGKTYSVSLMFHNNWNSSNVFYYASPTSKDTLISNTHWGSLVCHSVILVFDGLGSNDFDIADKIESVFSISPSQNVTIILIYNCDEVNSNFKKMCDDAFRSRLIDKFSTVNVAHKEYIKFESLSQVHLGQCIDKALDGYTLEEQQYQHLLNNFNVDMDGCKGVQSKVQLLKQSS